MSPTSIDKSGVNGEASIAKLAQSKRGARIRALLVAVAAAGVFAGARASRTVAANPTAELTEQALDGDWDLQTVNGYAVGPNVQSVILSQKVHFEGGRIRGVTRVRADSDAATTSMPFPDESVTQVKSEVGSPDITAVWGGTYHILDGSRIELTIGAATYRAQVSQTPSAHELVFDHDTILTYKGPARYRYAPRATTPPIVYF